MSLCLAAALWAASAGAAPQDARAREQIHVGKDLFQAGRYAQAVDAFFSALEAAPENVEAKTYLARVGEIWLQAEARAAMTPQERAQALSEVALVLRRRKERLSTLELELQEVRRQIERGLADPQGLLQASRSLSRFRETEIGDRIMAEQSQRYLELLQGALRKAIQREGTFQNPKDVLVVRGYLWYYKGDLGNALREWQRAFTLAPEDAMLGEQIRWASRKKALLERSQTILQLSERARERTRLQQLDQAVLDWRSLVILDPQNDEFQRSLLRVEESIRKAKAAKALARADRALQGGRLSEASAYLLEVLEADPTNRRGLEGLKQIQKDLSARLARRAPETARDERGAVASAPALLPASGKLSEEQYTLGLIYYSQGDLTRARSALEAARQHDPTNVKVKNALDRITAELNP